MITVTDRIDLGNYEYINLDARYTDPNGNPFSSVSAAQTYHAGKMNELFIGLTVLVKESGWTEAKEYWVQPKGTTPETYGLVEKGAGTTDYADLDNKPTISDGGQGSAQIPLSGNVKVTATAATSGQTTGVTVTAENGGITMAFTLEKGTDGVNGKSAYQQWLDEGNTGDETDFLNSLKAQIGKFIYSGYKATAAALSIGGTTTEALATGATNDSIVLMPNDGTTPTATMMFSVSVSDDPTPVTTYTYIGDVNVDASAFIGSDKIVQDLNTGGAGNVPSAAAVKELNDNFNVKLEGVTASETKVIQQPIQGSYVKGTDGTIISSNNTAYLEIALGDAKSVRFLGGWYASSSYTSGYAFGHYTDPSDPTTWVTDKSSVFDTNASTSGTKQYIIAVPEGATHFRTTTATGSVPALAQNFYCYLQSGESVVEVIDGLDKKINGEDYEVIGDDIRPASRNVGWVICKSSATGTDNALDYVSSNASFNFNLTEEYRGKKLLVKGNATYDSYCMVLKKKISSTDAPYTVQQLKDGEYLCEEVHRLDGTWYPSRYISPNGTEIPIPNDAIRILFTGHTIGDSLNRNVQSVQVISTEHINGTIDNVKEDLQQQIDSNKEDIEELQGVGEQVDGLIDDLYGVPTEITETPLMYVRKGSLDPTAFHVNPSVQTIYEIDINDATKVNISAQADKYLNLFVSKAKLPTSGNNLNVSSMRSNYMAVCDGFAPESGQYRIVVNSGASIELTLNENCKYLYISKYYGSQDRTPSSITTTKTKRVGGIIEQILEEEESNVSNALKLIIKDGTCFTAPIPCEKGFHLLVKDDYRITNAYLIDHLTGKIVNDDFIASSISSVQNKAYRRRSNMCKMPGFDIMYQIEKLDGSIIESSSAVIEDFSLVEDLYTRKLPTSVEPSIYRAWRDKVQTSIGNVWIPSMQAANKIPQSYENSNPKRFGKGTTYIGVNYSGPTQWGKHVGMQVSMRTFKTAVANPRSVMYTEIIGSYGMKTAQSKYGYTHNSYGEEAGAFYGCVCTGLTSYLMGFPMVFQSSQWNHGSVATQMNIVMQGTTSNPNVISCNDNEYSYDSKDDCKALAELLQPMDFIWKDEHCAAISDIYVDEWGEVKYIVISEQTLPTSTSNAYTPEYFFLRFKNNIAKGDNWKILRRIIPWTIEDASIPRTNQDKEFVVMNNSQYNPEDMGVIDSDITTFAGEYAVFVIGDYSDTTNNFKMFLNIHRGGAEGYTHIQIFNEDDDETTATPVDEIDITSYQTDSSLGTNGYILPSDEDEDWIIYNLAEYWRTSQTNNTGKFKARVVRKESGSIVEDYVSGCTHFMMVAMSLNLNNSTINYTVKGAIPVVCYCEEETGLYNGSSRYKNLVLDTDYTYNSETGEYTSVGTPLGSWTGVYLRLFAKTDYGMANVKVAISNS